MTNRFQFACVMACAIFAECAILAPQGMTAPLKVVDGRLMLDGHVYRGVGVNYFDLFNRVLHAPSNMVNHATLDGLKKLSEGGIPFVRFALGFGVSDMKRYVDNRDEYFRRLDLVVRAAEVNHVGLIPSFFWCMDLPDLVGEHRDQWGNPDSKTCAMMRRFTADVVRRYKDSPAFWGYEFGNEPNLHADLPNAASFRPKGGTERDDLKSAHLVVMLSEFAKEIRRYDPDRPIFTGNSHSRASSWHNTAEKSWKSDTRAQSLEILRRDNPAPLDTISIHLYADAPVVKECAAWATNHVEYLAPVVAEARATKRPVWVGEFGLASKKDDDAATRESFETLIAAMEQTGVDLAAVWVYDLANQKDWNVTFDNQRAYMLKLAAEANRRWNKEAAGGVAGTGHK